MLGTKSLQRSLRQTGGKRELCGGSSGGVFLGDRLKKLRGIRRNLHGKPRTLLSRNTHRFFNERLPEPLKKEKEKTYQSQVERPVQITQKLNSLKKEKDEVKTWGGKKFQKVRVRGIGKGVGLYEIRILYQLAFLGGKKKITKK